MDETGQSNRVEWEYILEKACREINSIPIARCQEFVMLSPACMIYPAENEDLSIPVTVDYLVFSLINYKLKLWTPKSLTVCEVRKWNFWKSWKSTKVVCKFVGTK